MAKNDKKQNIEGAVDQVKLDFEAWYGQREKLIPAHHRKEVIKADFKGRKVPELATMEEFDQALKLYGVELNDLA